MNKQAKAEAQARSEVKSYLALRSEFASRLKGGGADYNALHRAARKRIKRWEWFSAPTANLNPGWFIFEDDKNFKTNKRGRRIQSPAARANATRQGFDEAGAVQVIETGNTTNEFWEYSPDRIDATTYEGRRPILIQTLWLKDGRPKAHIFYNRHVMTIRLYEYAGDKLVKVIQSSGLQRKERYLNIRGILPEYASQFGDCMRTARADATISYRLESACKKKTNGSVPTLNLKSEIAEVRTFVIKAVCAFAKKQRSTRARNRPSRVSGVGLGYCYYSNGGSPCVLVHFDTRDEFEDDGTWTHAEFATLNRSAWETFWTTWKRWNNSGVLIDARGRNHNVGAGIEPVAWFGEMLANALCAASRDQAFKSLQKVKSCSLVVHDIDFAFGWHRRIRSSKTS